MVEYGRTLGLERGGDIYRDDQKKSAWFDGLRGAEQELKLTLATVEGEQPFAPNFGLDVFAIAGASDPIIKREVRRALVKDNRVASVDEVIIEQSPDQKANRVAKVTVNLTLVSGEGLQLSGVELG